MENTSNKNFVICALFLLLTFIFLPKVYACTEVSETYVLKKNSSEEDIFEFAEFVKLNYSNEFEIFPELDGIDFFARYLNQDTCDRGFRIIMDKEKNIIIDSSFLIIDQSSSYKNCSEILRKVVADFQSQKNLPKTRVEVICEKRI